MNNLNKAETYGKVVKFPDNTLLEKVIENLNNEEKVQKAMESVKIPRNKHWYFITNKKMNTNGEQIHLVQWNMEGVDASNFVLQLREHYTKKCDSKMKELFETIKIVGNDKFTIIDNIPDIMVKETDNTGVIYEKKLVNKITSDLIKLLK